VKKITPKRALAISLILFLIGFAFVSWGTSGKMPVMVVGIAIMLAAFAVRFAFYRCPHCGNYLGRSFGDYCPSCGKELNG
jgi:hypothetical protein